MLNEGSHTKVNILYKLLRKMLKIGKTKQTANRLLACLGLEVMGEITAMWTGSFFMGDENVLNLLW